MVMEEQELGRFRMCVCLSVCLYVRSHKSVTRASSFFFFFFSFFLTIALRPGEAGFKSNQQISLTF